MTGAEAWGHWQVENTLQLACYVVPGVFAGTGLVPPDIYDLREAGPKKAVAALYQALAERGIHYERAAPNSYRAVQTVRQPHVVLEDRQATCLDIALLFAGLCLSSRLRPLVAVFRRADGSAHALVVLPPHEIDEHDEIVWAYLPTAAGLLKPTYTELLDRVRAHGWIAVETTGLTHWKHWPAGRLDFEQAQRQAEQELRGSAGPILMVDPASLQRDGRYRPLPALPLAEGERTELDPAVRERYGEPLRKVAAELGVPPPEHWTRQEVRRLADRLPPAHRETLAALRDAMAARRVLDRIGATGGGLDQLRHLYARHVGCWPDPASATLDALLVAAASVTIRERRTGAGAGRTLCALAGFVLGLATASGMESCDDPVLRTLLTEDLGHQLDDALHYLEDKCRGRAWLLVDLGDDTRTGALEWPSSVTATLVEAGGRVAWKHTEPAAPTREGLEAGLRALFRKLPAGQRLLVDLVAPHALFDQGIEHWPVVEIGDWAESFHDMDYRPRYRWSKRERHERMRVMLQDRADEADWTRPPRVVPHADEARLRHWLRANPQPYVLAAAKPLPVLLKQGYGFIAWYPSGTVPAEELGPLVEGRPAYALRSELPDHIAELAPEDTVVIWDDPHGRAEFRRPRRRALESPRSIGVV